MKTLLILLLAASCGFEPLAPPLSCSNGKPICVCNSDGECSWSWICS